MEYPEILEVVKKYLVRAVDDLSMDQIDPEKSMMSYGATSLDVVEVVSSSMRELKIKIPRSELNDIKNIAGLAQVLSKYAKEKVE